MTTRRALPSQMAYAVAKEMVRTEQQRRFGPPSRPEIRKIISRIMEECGLDQHPSRRYFELWATCALINEEKLCRFWKRRPKVGKTSKHKQSR